MKRGYVLGLPVDLLNISEIFQKLEQAAQNEYVCLIITLNAEMAMRAFYDHDLKRIIENADLVVPDGSGILWALRRKNIIAKRIPGIELLLELVKKYQNRWRFYFLGAREGVAEKAAKNIFLTPYKEQYRTHHGYTKEQEEESLIEEIKGFRPHCLAVGMGATRQEKWLKKYKDVLNVPILIGVGGAFDCLSGNLKRAPHWMQEMGLEWLFRTFQEPTRWTRVLNLVKFCFLVWQEERNGKRKYIPE